MYDQGGLKAVLHKGKDHCTLVLYGKFTACRDITSVVYYLGYGFIRQVDQHFQSQRIRFDLQGYPRTEPVFKLLCAELRGCKTVIKQKHLHLVIGSIITLADAVIKSDQSLNHQ